MGYSSGKMQSYSAKYLVVKSWASGRQAWDIQTGYKCTATATSHSRAKPQSCFDEALIVGLHRKHPLNSKHEYSTRHAGLGVIEQPTPSSKVLHASNRRYSLDIGSGQAILDTFTTNEVQTTQDPPFGQNSSSFPPPHSERDEGAVLKPTLWTNLGAASAYFVVPVDLKPCPPYRIDLKLAISEHNVHHTPLNPSKHYPEYAFTQTHYSVLGNKEVTAKEERLVTSVYDEDSKEDWLYGAPTSIQEGSTCQRWRKKNRKAAGQ